MGDISHDDLAHKLAQHLDCSSRMVWENIPAGMSGSVRPDVYTLEKSFSSPNPITYEVKVSVSDFRSDVTSGKWKEYLNFSYGVVFAVPKGLITKNDIPNGCGLITYNGEGLWHTAKKPTLNPCEIPCHVLLKLMMCGEERRTQFKPIQPRQFDKWKHMETLSKKFGKDIGEKINFIEEYPDMKKELIAIKKELSSILDVEIDRWCFIKDCQYKIDQIKKMADESGRKRLISDRLDSLNKSINNEILKIQNEYAR